MFQRLAISSTLFLWTFVPQKTHATMDVDAPFGMDELLANIAGHAWKAGFGVCAAVFIAGAFFYISSMGAEDRKGYGKSMMIGAVIGVIIIAGAQVIMNTVLSFVYKT